MKREVNCILITILLAAILIMAGCGKACPVTCNDNNTCTADSCGKETGYLCANTPIANCHIGNGRCEPNLNETKCNAPADCGQCTDQAAAGVFGGARRSFADMWRPRHVLPFPGAEECRSLGTPCRSGVCWMVDGDVLCVFCFIAVFLYLSWF